MQTHITAKLSVLALLVSGAIAQDQAPRPAGDFRSVSTGDYLRSDYIEKLNATHSSLRAETSGTAQLIQVSRESGGLRFSVIFNFHEGGYDFLMREDGSFVDPDGFNHSNPVMKVLTARSFTLKFDKFPAATYQFVGNVNSYVGERMLAGKYQDHKGRPYVFRKDGWAIFPDRKFQYEIGLDHVLTGYDYFWDKDSKKVYAIKKTAGTLNIFKTYGEMDESVENRPILALRTVSGKE